MEFKIEDIRNVTIAAHVDHGKSTLADTLLAHGGLMSDEDAGSKRGTDNRIDEQERGITIKSTGVSIIGNYQNRNIKVNIVDTPGHFTFNGEVSAALRITDGAL